MHEQATKDARELAEARLKIFELEMERAGAPPEQRAPGFSGVVEEALRASRREAAADRRETNRLKFRSAANAVHAARAAAPVPSPGFADVVGEARRRGCGVAAAGGGWGICIGCRAPNVRD